MSYATMDHAKWAEQNNAAGRRIHKKPRYSKRGGHKVTEEAGELLQVLGKLGPFPSGAHPDGRGDLRGRLEEEIADVEAALAYFAVRNGLDLKKIQQRRLMKIARFNHWDLTGVPADQEPQS